MSAGHEVQQTTISMELARALRDYGLEWRPRNGDCFAIPDRGFEDLTFTVSDMVIEVRDVLGQRELAFNGTVEWALDSIRKAEVIWLPTEEQLRQVLDERFVALYRDEDGAFACVARIDGEPKTFTGTNAADAYAWAVLADLSARGDG